VKKADAAGGSNAVVAASTVAEALSAGVQKMAVDGDALPQRVLGVMVGTKGQGVTECLESTPTSVPVRALCRNT
jgi:hypothetical protein